VYLPDDGGTTWSAVRHGLDRRYVMAIAVDPADPDCWYAAAAPLLKAHSGNSHARVYRRAERSWIAVSDGLRELPHALPCPRPNALVAGLRNRTIRLSRDRGQTWDALATADGVGALV